MVNRKQRRRRLARAKWERQQQRRVQRARRRRRNGIVVGTALGVVIALVASFLIVQLVTGGSSDGAESGAPARVESDRSAVTAAPLERVPGDRLPGPDRGSTFQVSALSTGDVESSPVRPDPTAGERPTTGSHGSYTNGVDRLDTSVVIDKPKIAA